VPPDAQYCPNCGQNLRQPTPTPRSPSASYSFPDPDASSARTLTLVAIVFQLIFFLIGIFAALFVFSATAGVPFGFSLAFVFGAIFVFAFALSVIWIALDYLFVYRNLQRESDVPKARMPALVLGVIQLIFGGLIPGVLLIVAYIKIGESMRRRGQQY
jgi:hypothetical protein